eukprot:COSAG01_NODE_3192_length_6435_cov_14.950284_6_plen_83_part_00
MRPSSQHLGSAAIGSQWVQPLRHGDTTDHFGSGSLCNTAGAEWVLATALCAGAGMGLMVSGDAFLSRVYQLRARYVTGQTSD